MSTILSFDVGIKNLSYCLICDEEIIDWDLISLQEEDDKSKKGKSLSEVTPKLFRLLKEKFEHHIIDHVVIENQPVMKNPTMKSIQMLIYSYFYYLKTIDLIPIDSVEFIGASTKVKLAENILKSKEIEFEKGTNKYKYNKAISIKCVIELLQSNSSLLEFFNDHKKKDDLADCYLLALVYLFRKQKLFKNQKI
jgi:hypothetical protein